MSFSEQTDEDPFGTATGGDESYKPSDYSIRTYMQETSVNDRYITYVKSNLVYVFFSFKINWFMFAPMMPSLLVSCFNQGPYPVSLLEK